MPAEVPNWASVIYCLAGAVIVAESLNKLERSAPLLVRGSWRERLAELLKALAWALLALGGAGAAVGPVFGLAKPSLDSACIAVGFAVLIVRTRVKEG